MKHNLLKNIPLVIDFSSLAYPTLLRLYYLHFYTPLIPHPCPSLLINDIDLVKIVTSTGLSHDNTDCLLKYQAPFSSHQQFYS